MTWAEQLTDNDREVVVTLLKRANPFSTETEIDTSLVTWFTDHDKRLVVTDRTDNGVLTGCAFAFLKDDGTAHLDDIAVLPRYEKRGIASELLATVEVWARESGSKTLTLEVSWRCAGAIPWYYARGFRGDGWTKDRFGPGEDCLCMSKQLSSAGCCSGRSVFLSVRHQQRYTQPRR